MASVDRVARRLDEYAASTKQPNPVRAPAESQWREPVVVVCLDDVKPEFDVPGRRKDGTVKGRRLVHSLASATLVAPNRWSYFWRLNLQSPIST